MIVARSPENGLTAAVVQDTPRVSWRERATWTALAAIPSSLMLGVTAYLATDVASAPFLWVAPLALYLLTFIVAFQTKPAIPPGVARFLQAGFVCACVAMLPFETSAFLAQIGVHLGAFFFTALVCHQALVARRPPPARLTEFYLCLSLGGVLGGGFNAFLAPVIFDNVVEYPLVLALACLARPWSYGQVGLLRWGVFIVGCAAAVAAPIIANGVNGEATAQILLAAAAFATFLNQSVLLLFFPLIVMLSVAASESADRADVTGTWRSFFGVLRETQTPVPGIGGQVRMLAHGTTMHGAQALNPIYACRPLTYYAPETPIGQVFVAARADKPALRIGAVGLGTGSVAAYVRPQDRLTFFEIDPLVVRIANDPKHFSYTTRCAQGPVDFIVGDARLTLAQQPKDRFDVLLIDAFSSDAVPAHLLTVEAVKSYLERLKPDGVLILHLSNRNLDLAPAATAVVAAAGGKALHQTRGTTVGTPPLWESPVEAMIVAKTPDGIAPYLNDGRWETPAATTVRPWTDDYTNLPGALYARLKGRWAWLP
jgi:SAM-dependent methyltransferase